MQSEQPIVAWIVTHSSSMLISLAPYNPPPPNRPKPKDKLGRFINNARLPVLAAGPTSPQLDREVATWWPYPKHACTHLNMHALCVRQILLPHDTNIRRCHARVGKLFECRRGNCCGLTDISTQRCLTNIKKSNLEACFQPCSSRHRRCCSHA